MDTERTNSSYTVTKVENSSGLPPLPRPLLLCTPPAVKTTCDQVLQLQTSTEQSGEWISFFWTWVKSHQLQVRSIFLSWQQVGKK